MGVTTDKVTAARELINDALRLCEDCTSQTVTDLRMLRADLDLVLERLKEPAKEQTL